MPTTKSKLPISKRDLANLRESGLTDRTIKANGLETRAGALRFPYTDIDGETNGFARTRPHRPRVVNGKPAKYEQPKGSGLRAYLPAASRPKLRKSKITVYVTEGEKKALALAQIGKAAVGLGGVWGACKKGAEEDLIDDLAEIDWTSRKVYVVFDYDEKAKTRRHVMLATQRLAKVLRAAGTKEVYTVKLPPGPGGDKQGVDDFLVSHGKEAFLELVKSAQPITVGVRPVRVTAGRTDAANAARLVDQHGEDIRRVGPWRKWQIWDDTRWKADEECRIDARAKQTANKLWKEVAAEVAQGDLDKKVLGAMYSFVRSSNSAKSVQAMIAMAKSEPGVSVAVADLDARPWLLNVANGTVDLRTGELREHRREDLLTQITPVKFDPSAACPIWDTFLAQIFKDTEELIGYTQRLVGYGLTGTTEEHVLPFGYGLGANGKSTFIETILKLLGPEYSMKAAPDLLIAKNNDSHPTERADLFGKRFVAAVETEAGRRLAESLVKELTGGDRIRARRMREDFWEFTPTHKVWLIGNHHPTVYGTDHGLWRRLKLIPFNVQIPDEEQDKKLPEKLAAELPGILNWAIEGCLEWQRNGLQEPDIVTEATKEYSEENDDVGEFIAVYCKAGPEYSEPATRLYEHFRDENPESNISQNIFGAQLRQRGFVNFRITRGENKSRKAWRGLKYVGEETEFKKNLRKNVPLTEREKRIIAAKRRKE